MLDKIIIYIVFLAIFFCGVSMTAMGFLVAGESITAMFIFLTLSFGCFCLSYLWVTDELPRAEMGKNSSAGRGKDSS